MIHSGGTARGKIYTRISLLKHGGADLPGVYFPVTGYLGCMVRFSLKKNRLR